jgi:hypothetical protein
MSRQILLIGGPKHGETIALPDEINFKRVDTQEGDDGSTLYTICRTGDGHFYGVFDPVDDPSVERINTLRNALREAADRRFG